MSDDDQILRAYAAITSIRANVPERHEVEARWVNEFNAAIAKLEKSLDIDLQEFKVPQDALKRYVASCNSLTNDVTYLEGLWCERRARPRRESQYARRVGRDRPLTLRRADMPSIAVRGGHDWPN